jgi:rare lipoprotein A
MRRCARLLVVAALVCLVLALPAEAEMATFYADGYEGGVTASGDMFSNGGWTAAHPYLPFGTVVDVCDADSCIYNVVINDRCACSIDLTQNAAAALYPLEYGTVPVSVYPH